MKRLADAGINRARRVALLLHRYVGLLMTVFLVVAGTTGALLAFVGELDRALNPELMRAAPDVPGAAPLEPFALYERVRAQLGAGHEDMSVTFAPEPERAISTWVEVAPDKYREYFVNPYNGKVQGSREWGNLSEGTRNLMPFIYRLHYSLALDEVGTLVFGIVALLWTVDCFVGAYLTFPAPDRRARRSPGAWLKRWLPAWQIRTNKLFSFAFTWHRASGLWIWAALLVFAWSAVGLNLSGVYKPVMKTLAGLEEPAHERLPQLSKPFPKPRFSPREAHAVGRRLMAEQAKQRGFTVERELWLNYHADHGAFAYGVASSLDISRRHPRTELYFDGQDGHLIAFDAASGIAAGNTITSWLYALHFAAIGGVWYQIVVCVMGLAVATLSVTGVWIWWRKRKKRDRAVARESTVSQLQPAE